jgi:hypothetical protein
MPGVPRTKTYSERLRMGLDCDEVFPGIIIGKCIVYICLHLFTSAYNCLHLFTSVYICLHLFTTVYNCLHLFTTVYICLHLFTSIYICLHLFTSVYICLNLFTSVYICLHLSRSRDHGLREDWFRCAKESLRSCALCATMVVRVRAILGDRFAGLMCHKGRESTGGERAWSRVGRYRAGLMFHKGLQVYRSGKGFIDTNVYTQFII